MRFSAGTTADASRAYVVCQMIKRPKFLGIVCQHGRIVYVRETLP